MNGYEEIEITDQWGDTYVLAYPGDVAFPLENKTYDMYPSWDVERMYLTAIHPKYMVDVFAYEGIAR